MTELLDAVDALTLPVKRKIIQEILEGSGTTATVTITDDPLLERLEQSIRATIGIGGSGSAPNERNVLNNEALFKALQITDQVKSWARGVGMATRPTDQPIPLLRQWYVLFEQTPRFHEDHSFYLKMLRGWANSIEAMFDPPRTRDLPDACPVCEASTWWQAGLEYPRPLVLTFHEGPEMIEKGQGKCRACEATFGLRELSYALDEKAQQQSA